MTPDRFLDVVRRLVRALIAPTAYHALVRYRIVTNSFGRAELQAVRRLGTYPDTLPISFQPGAPGISGVPALGAIVLVAFIEGDPTLPVIVQYARTDDPAWKPISVVLDASLVIGGSATNFLGRPVRWGDIAVLGTASGTLTPFGATLAAGVPDVKVGS